MEVNGTTQNNDESNFSEDQTLGFGDDQTSTVISIEAQDISDNETSSGSNSPSNVNNAPKSNTSVVSSDSSQFGTDAIQVANVQSLRGVTVTSQLSSAKGSDTTNNGDSNSTIGGSFLKNLFEINGPASRSINELLEEYPYLPYYSLFSLLTASTGRESVERMLEWMRHLQAKQVTTTEGLIKNKEYITEKQFLDAESEDDKTQANARAGVSPSGGTSDIDTTDKCLKIFIITIVVILVVAASVVTGGLAAGAAGLAVGASTASIAVAGAVVGGGTFIALSAILAVVGMIISGVVSAVSKSPSTRAKVKEYCDLLTPTNAIAEIIVMVAELFIDDEETLKWIRWIARIVLIIIYVALAIFASIYGAIAISAIFSSAVGVSGLVGGIIQIVQAALTLSTLEKQKDVAKKRLKYEAEIAYCEKLQKDLDIIASEIDMIVEFFTAAMDKIRAEYDRISRMIKETSDVKNMIARNIGA